MGVASNDGVTLWWEASGDGEPLVLINGLSSPSDLWFRLIPHLESSFRVIRFDNRGTGRSDVPVGPYTGNVMASDVEAVLDAASVSSAHVLGLSMGGLIAQEFVVSRPDRVRSLVLAATHPGVSRAIPSADAAQVLAAGTGKQSGELHEAVVPLTYAASTERERIDEDLAVRAHRPTSLEGYANQLLGMSTFDRYDDLAEVRVPTLVLHGEEDKLVPVDNARVLADAIPDSRLMILARASHQLFTDQEEAAAHAVLGFLDTVATGLRTP